MAEDLEFKISSGLKDIIGKDLITDDFIAVFELVKNSFDARAKNVEIIFENDKIIITDNGKGMSYDDLINKWLFVAYSAKKDNAEDYVDNSYIDKIQEKRYYAGAKGIGRFSSDRLGRFLSIKTMCFDSNEVENIVIDWNKFEIDQTDTFEKIKVKHDLINDASVIFPKNAKKGTILEISGLHKSWNRNRILELKYSLEKLINPFSSSNDFEIYIKCEKEKNEDINGVYTSGKKKGERFVERDKVNGPVKNVILDILELKTSQLNFTIIDNCITTKIIDRGELIYHITEEIPDFNIISDLKIDLFYLNRAAKYNFSLKMGIQPIQFGSIFLFKNGFRVQPFGKTGDDSWGIDFRAQQGYNRFLGTRDLFGRVDITTDNQEQFKEVSSRDGGLVETSGYFELIRAFEIAHRRLERYVVGVLWGEAFKRKHYFGTDDLALQKADNYRESLSEDKDSSDLEIIKSNLGSKIDFIQIIKSLASDKNVKIIDYNRAFVDLVNENIDEHQTRFISDLEKIAKITDDEELKNQILKTEERYKDLKQEKEEAERKAIEEERKRIEAEKKAEEAERRRFQEENRRKEEEERRRKAELETEIKEKERALAELAKLKAQQKAKEEEEARKKAENDAKLSQKTAEKVEKKLVIEEKRRLFSEAQNSLDVEHVLGIQHQTGLLAGTLFKDFNWILKQYKSDSTSVSMEECINEIERAMFIIEKIQQLSNFATRANFDVTSNWMEDDLGLFISDYIMQVSKAGRNVKLKENIDVPFIKKFRPIEISMIIDNAINNAQKAGAKNINIEINSTSSYLSVSIINDGKKLTDKYSSEDLLKKGVTTTSGSGLGLYHINKIVADLKGKVAISNTNQGTLLKIDIFK